MTRALYIGALLLGCHGQPEGSTFCGVGLFDLEDGEARKLQFVEALSLSAIEDVAKRKDGAPMSGSDVCGVLRGLRLYMRSEPMRSVTCDCSEPPLLCGATHIRPPPEGDWMELWRAPAASGLCSAHEVLHYAQWKLDGEAEPHHDSWTARGYYAATKLASERVFAEGL